METNWATEHLQTIRTLMERSALYRRALAPITTFVGTVGVVAAILGWTFNIRSDGPFAYYWMLVGLIAVSGALLLVRRQSVKQGEPFWSPPTRRVAQAMTPALFVGLIFGLFLGYRFWRDSINGTQPILVMVWTLFYGLALHSAGFFMPRGIRFFAWFFIFSGLAFLLLFFEPQMNEWRISSHVLMGLLFGASHLVYGIYLYFTERKNEA